MKTARIALLSAGLLTAGSLLAVAAPAPSAAAPAAPALAASSSETLASGAFTLDAVHSSVVFSVRHMGVANFWGRFNKMDAKVDLNPEHARGGSITITIDAASVDTGNQRRDDHLRNPDFFNAKEFPSVTFTSTMIERRDGYFRVTGDLAMIGTTRSMTVDLKQTGKTTHPRSGKPLIGLEADFTIRRSDFNMNFGIEQGSLSDEVRMIFGLEMLGE
jgi:polyisoprenoid-binding protein YceI